MEEFGGGILLLGLLTVVIAGGVIYMSAVLVEEKPSGEITYATTQVKIAGEIVYAKVVSCKLYKPSKYSIHEEPYIGCSVKFSLKNTGTESGRTWILFLRSSDFSFLGPPYNCSNCNFWAGKLSPGEVIEKSGMVYTNKCGRLSFTLSLEAPLLIGGKPVYKVLDERTLTVNIPCRD